MAKRPSSDSVNFIDLTEDDDDREEKLQDVRKRLKSTPAAAAAKVKVERHDDDDDGGGKSGSCAVLQRQASQQQTSEVLVVESLEPTFHPVARAASASTEDVELVGTANESRLPHMRQHCPDHKFIPDAHRAVELDCIPFNEVQKSNAQCCELCFCFVCDKPAKECDQWNRTHYYSHCHASDTPKWRRLRQQAKNPSVNASQPQLSYQSAPSTRGTGPFGPDNVVASQDTTLTKCRKCGWYNRFDHKNFELKGQKHPTGFLDWCQSCGRVASEEDFGKSQGVPYNRQPGDVFLGTRVVPFRIVAHDPRQMKKFRQRWADNGWEYSKADMEHDMFCHRFGQHPLLAMILASIPVCSPKIIPKDGSLYDSDHTGYFGESHAPKLFSADETDAIILGNSNDRVLFDELRNFKSVGCQKPVVGALGGDIVANWDAATSSGTFTIRIFLQPKSFQGPAFSFGDCDYASLSKVLGAWFDIFPFSLPEVCGPIRASPPDKPLKEYTAISQKRCDKYENFLKKTCKSQKKAVTEKLSKLSLNPSGSKLLGGTCAFEPNLAGILKSYFREIFAEDVHDSGTTNGREQARNWIRHSGPRVRSLHRNGRLSGQHCILTLGKERNTSFESYVSDKDHALTRNTLCKDSRSIMNSTTSMKGVLDHLENLHHPSVPFVEGLTVELLDFQRQSVQWALEREKTPGGVQSLLWAKLPSVAEPGHEIYFNPILERFRKDKPRLVRGGIIAEEMGLGKTVISLALILENPAPVAPLSGSAVTVLNAAAGTGAGNMSPWDKELYDRTSESNSKRGSILSRGTLVVCHVSLVGQWIDEARSKLKDPGLVYPYHGQSRKRDAATLSKNSIVVTTYQTLASDATYHAAKAGSDYCAPCEQVRWWRIICDESHSIRDAGTKKSLAVMNLVADHKWLVSGTPVNTSFNDLKNQLQFIGLEDVGEMFQIFAKTAFPHVSDRAASRRYHYSTQDTRLLGHFMFLLRCLMIRHTQKQTYRGTSTTLMSLPPKVERTVEIDFAPNELKEYKALEKAALEFYTSFKSANGHHLSKHFLLLSQRLTPLRIAASGGQIPLDAEVDENDVSQDDEESTNEGQAKKKRKSKEQLFSDFAYKSKLNALLVELKRARDEDPQAKSLVFSQFASALKWLQQELPKNGFQFRTLSGDMTMKKRAKALHDFQHDPPTTIFLLSMRAGAVGINLTQANRVFLLEPSFNPALEAQAIGRVHRLGQKRNVEIVRLIMKDSVESRLVKMIEKKYATGAASIENGTNTRNVLVGSIQTDRTKVLSEEFDLLFGIESSKASARNDASPVADPVLSSFESVSL